MIWIFIALMTAAAAMAVLWPLSRRAAAARAPSDVAIYTDQLDEIERDQGFGLIAPAEADAARIEVSRRLIAAADAAVAAARKAPAAASPVRRRVVSLIGLIALPVGALAIYLAIGSPSLPGAPLAQRIAEAPAANQSVEELFARVEKHLEQHPDDGRGWEVIAPVYMRLGRYDDAVKARRNVLRLLGPTAERWSELGEALVVHENGVVTEDAKGAFDNALKIDDKDVMARFYTGLAAEQDGRKADAVRIWRGLAADAPPGAAWLPSVERALARVDPAAAAELDKSPPAAPPNEMIRAMVAQLDARLHDKDAGNVDGWIQLVRSYTVLREPDKAKAAGDDARRALAGDADKLARFEAGLAAIAAGPPSTPSPTPSPAPSPPAPAAATPSEDEMVRGMVARLDARLHQDGSDVAGWIRLLRSYVVLGEPDKARAALTDARNALKGDPDKLRQLDEGARSLGVGG
jgi:cytochrome c-type biogenesis protein CcmH